MFVASLLIILVILAIIEAFTGWSPLPNYPASGTPYKDAARPSGFSYYEASEKITPRGGPTKVRRQPLTAGEWMTRFFWIGFTAIILYVCYGWIVEAAAGNAH